MSYSVLSSLPGESTTETTFASSTNDLIQKTRDLVIAKGQFIKSITHHSLDHGKLKFSRLNIEKIIAAEIKPDYEKKEHLEVGEPVALFEQLKLLKDKFVSFSLNGN